MCTTMYTRERVTRYPHDHRSKLLLVVAPHLVPRGHLGGILNKPVSIRKLGTFWQSEGKGMRHVGGQSEGHSEVNIQ